MLGIGKNKTHTNFEEELVETIEETVEFVLGEYNSDIFFVTSRRTGARSRRYLRI